MQNHSCGYEFSSNTNKRYRYIHINGFSLGLKRRLRATRKWLFLYNCLSSVEKWKLPLIFILVLKQKQNKLECSVFQALGLCGQGAAKNKEKRGGGNEGRLERGACVMFSSRSA